MSVAGGAAAACMARRRYESTPQLSPSYLFPRAGRGAGTACLPNDAARGISKSLAAAPVTQASPAIAELPNWWLGVRVSGTRVVPPGEEDLMAIRLTLLPPAMIALSFLVNACVNEPTAAGTGSRAPAASLVAADPVALKLIPTAGNLVPPDFTKETGNGPYSQARWTSKLALEGKFSVLLTKSVDFASCYTATPQNGCAAFAAAIVSGVQGMTIADLGDIGFSVSGTCGGGSPRFNLFYDTDGDGQADGVAFYGCAAHVSGTPPPGWTTMSASALTPDFCYSFPNGDCTLSSDATVVELSVFVDELGVWNIDLVRAAGATTGEPNGT